MKKNIVFSFVAFFTMTAIAGCATNSPTNVTTAYHPSISQKNVLDNSTTATWDNLQHTSSRQLTAMQNEENNPEQKAWIELALISKRNSANTPQLAQQLINWHNRYPSHRGNQLLPADSTLQQLAQAAKPKQIAILLPQTGKFAKAGQTVREGFLNAYYNNLSPEQQQNIKFYDTSKNNLNTIYQQAVTDGADVIIGPLAKSEVQQLSSRSLEKPTIALNYSSSTRSTSTNLFEFGLLPEDDARQLAARARHAGLARALIIAPQDAWGQRLTTAFISAWKNNQGSIVDTYYFSKKSDFNADIARLLKVNPSADRKLMKTTKNKDELSQQRRQDFDTIILFAQPNEARTITPLLHFYYVNNIPIYTTAAAYNKNSPESEVDLNGVMICDIPWNMRQQHKTDDEIQSDRLYAVGQDAYLLSQSIQRLTTLPNFPIYGTTGALVADSTNQIHRRLPCRSIHHDNL